MAGILDSLMQGYADRVLGPDTSGQVQGTASAYARLQDAINQDYSQQQKMFETNPINKGKSWVPPSPTERLQDQINAMIVSGDPQLQKRGLELVGTIKPSTASKPAAIQEYQFAVNQGYQGSFADWKKDQKSGTTVNVSTGDTRGAYLTPEEKVAGGLDPAAPYVWTKDGPKPVQKSKESEEQKPINVAQTTVNDLDDMLFGDNGIMNDDIYNDSSRLQNVTRANVEAYTQNDPRYAIYDQTVTASLSNLARSIGGEKGALAEGDVQRVKSLLPVLTGINPDSKPVARQKIQRLQSLVKLARQKGGLTSEEIKKYTTGFGKQSLGKKETNKWGVPKVGSDANLPELPAGFKWDN